MRRILNFFDKLEDRVRGHLSRYPIVYAIIGGICVVLFWRGVWHTADLLEDRGGVLGLIFFEPINTIIMIGLLLLIGLFVSVFIGDSVILTGINKEKKLYERTEIEVKEESDRLKGIERVMKDVKKEIDEIKSEVKHVHEDAHKTKEDHNHQ